MPAAKKDEALSVSELTREIKSAVESRLKTVTVCGEVSDFRGIHASGHTYCTLKDSGSRIRMVIWRSTKLQFKLEEGMRVTIKGAVEVYGPHGSYQLIARTVEPEGVGALQMAFRQLCERLHKEGLFDEDAKKPLPESPKRIGIVTGPTTAALRDMLRIIKRRDPRMEVIVYPAKVQGDAAAGEIAQGLRFFNRHAKRLGVEAIIVGRGGGSFEDLWAFNEEIVARAIFASVLPVISAVGHEIDTTVADYVADLRAATPSEAGELIAPEFSALGEAVDDAKYRLERAVAYMLERKGDALERLEAKVESHSPQRRLRENAQRLDFASERLENILQRRLASWRGRLEGFEGRVASLSPLAVLKRGYSLMRTPKGRVVESISDVKAGDELRLSLSDGEVSATVLATEASARKGQEA